MMRFEMEQGHPEKGSNVVRWPLIGLLMLCVMVELLLQLGDYGLLGQPRLRTLAYEYAGYWPGLLEDWEPNYPAQPWLMFLTYGFLHGGLVHLMVNMMTLWSLGREVIRRVGPAGFIGLYAGAIVGGAIGYALFAQGPRPMVGASGALFGLAGALLAWRYVDSYTAQQRLMPVAQAVVLLVILNLVLWWAMDGQLAWETHLGGFIMGWIAALLIDPRPRRD